MKIFYYQAPVRNFGDDLNAWLWPRVWPGLERVEQYEWLIGIGSVLDGRLREMPGTKLVLGAGFRPHKIGPPPLDDLTIAAVRGRLTCKALGLDVGLAKGDPAVLTLDTWRPGAGQRGGVGFMPHYQTSRTYPLRAAVENAGLVYIDPEAEVEEVLQALSGVERLVTEAMHGAIVADALGVPWKRIGLYNHVREGRASVDFKWADWASVYGLKTAPASICELPLPARGVLARIVRRSRRAGRMRAVGAALRNAAADSGFQVSPQAVRRERCEEYRTMIAELSSRLSVGSGRG